MKTVDIRNEFIISNMYLVKSVAEAFADKYGVEKEELESYGYEGLIYAADYFDSNLNTEFTFYALKCIKKEIYKGLREYYGLGYSDLFFDFLKCKEHVENTFDIKLKDDKNLMHEIVNLINQKRKLSKKLNIYIINRLSLSLPDYFIDKTIVMDSRMEYDLELADIKNRIFAMLDILPGLESEIIKLRYGLVDGIIHSRRELATKFDISESKVSTVEIKALNKLKYVDTSGCFSELIDRIPQYNGTKTLSLGRKI